jgi:hypothetical protein
MTLPDEPAQQVFIVEARRIHRFDAGLKFAGGKIHYGLLWCVAKA